MRITWVAAAAVLAAGAASAQTAPGAIPAAPSPATPPALPPAAAPAAPDWRPLDPANTLVIDSTKGRMIMELRPDLAPLAVARIKTLARRGYYDGDLFYRVINGFMDQTGDKGTKQFRSDLPNLRAEFTFAGRPAGYVSVGSIPGGDVGLVGATPVQLNTPPAGPVTGWILFCPGVAAMPHYDDPNTANSQVFILRNPAPSLEKTFTAFGRVVAGEDAVRAIAVGEPPPHPDKMNRVRVLADIPAAERPRVQVMDAHGPAFAALLQKTVQAKGAAFSMCDLDLPTQVQ